MEIRGKENGLDLAELETLKESNQLEAKAAQGGLPADVWPSVSAFANTNGGTIVLGVKENKKTRELRVVGVPGAQKMLEDFTNASNSRDKLSFAPFGDEHLRLENLDGKEVIVIEVRRADRKRRPVYVGRDPFEGTYRRKFTGDYHCSREEVAAMLRDAAVEPLDMEPAEGSGVADLDFETVRAYRSLYNDSHRSGAIRDMEDSDFLCQIGAAFEEGGEVRLTLAGLLMFGKEYRIVRDYPGFFLDYQQTLGQNRRWEDRFTSQELEWSGNVFDFYRRTYNKLRQALKVPFKLKGDRRVDETPAHEALREAIVNALTNADYRSSRGVVFRWTDEGIEIVNPGCFRVGVDQAYHGGMSDARNKTLLKMFSLIEIGERAGSGIPNMVNQWTSCGYGKPELSESFDPEMSRTFLPLSSGRKPSNQQDDELSGGLSERERIALRIAKETGSVTTKALVEAANVGRQAASRTLKAMADRGLLEWHGSSPKDPSQHYTVR